MNRRLIIPVLAVTIAGVTAFAATQASATTVYDPHATLVQRIAQRFNITESDVQQVFDEVRAEHHMEMQARFEEKLTQAVSAGKLTEAQKQTILAKHEELVAEHEAERATLQDMTPEQRREYHQTQRAQLEAWAKEQGIELNYFMPMSKVGGKHMRGFGASAPNSVQE